jgi:hypothetical protein
LSEKNRKILVYAVFVVAVIWGFFNLTGRKSDRSEATNSKKAASTDQSNMVPSSPQAPLAGEVIEIYREQPWGRDPFYHGFKPPKIAKTSPEIRMHLFGILYRQINPQALINNRVVGVGDVLGDYKVIEITRGYVALNNGKRTVKLKVKKESS